MSLQTALSEEAINQVVGKTWRTQHKKERLISQTSQDDSVVCYNGNGAQDTLLNKSLSEDAQLANSKSNKYNSCNLLLEQFLLGRATAKSCPSEVITSQSESESFLRLVEVVPPGCSYSQTAHASDSKGWKMSLAPFRMRSTNSVMNLPKNVRRYYKQQNSLIRSFEESERLFSDYSEDQYTFTYIVDGCDRRNFNHLLGPTRYYKQQNSLIRSFEESERLFSDYSEDEYSYLTKFDTWPQRLAIISLIVNIVLLIAKACAVHLSGSIAIISSLVDSGVDIVASMIIWWTSTAVVKRDPYVYPEGRTRLEPIAVITLSVLMSLAAIQLVVESIECIISLHNGQRSPPNVQHATITIMLFAIVTKLILYVSCRYISSRSVSVKALQLDHRNDVFSNTLAIVCAYLGSLQAIKSVSERNLMYIDPLGAMVMSAYIMANWWHVGIEQVKLLTGHTATPQFLSKLTWICLNHHQALRQVDTVRAFHFGNNFLVEVDIVLPPTMNIRESHDIGESLQHKLEKLVEVERAFVHLDYETTHDPGKEHKTV